MKIYFENQNQNQNQKQNEKQNEKKESFSESILKKMIFLDKYFSTFEINNEIYCEEGIFTIDEKSLQKCLIIDKPIIKVENYYKNIDLLLDTSEIIKEDVFQIPSNHITLLSVKFYYKLTPESKIHFVVEGNFINNTSKTNEKNFEFIYNDLTKNIKNIKKYANFIPSNYYFEVPKYQDIHNYFFREDLIVFLSDLN